MSSKYMVTHEMLEGMVRDVSYTVIGETLTICNIICKNGFSVTGESACVDPANFDKKKGEMYAYESAFNKLWPLAGFLMKQRMYEDETQVDRIAKLCHEVNRAYCEGLGDFSQKHWDKATDDQRESARLGVQARLEQQLTPEEQHNLWMRHKLANGWVYGERKDEVAKKHPCIVPYSLLPEKQKIKDLLFGAIVDTMKD